MADELKSPKSPTAAPPVTLNIGQVIGPVTGVVHGFIYIGTPGPAAAPPAGSLTVQAPLLTDSSAASPAPDLALTPSVPLAIRADVVYLSAPADEPHRQTLALHLRPALDRLGLTDWHVRDTPSGAAPAAALDSALRSARGGVSARQPRLPRPARALSSRRASRALPCSAGLRIVPISSVADRRHAERALWPSRLPPQGQLRKASLLLAVRRRRLAGRGSPRDGHSRRRDTRNPSTPAAAAVRFSARGRSRHAHLHPLAVEHDRHLVNGCRARRLELGPA